MNKSPSSVAITEIDVDSWLLLDSKRTLIEEALTKRKTIYRKFYDAFLDIEHEHTASEVMVYLTEEMDGFCYFNEFERFPDKDTPYNKRYFTWDDSSKYGTSVVCIWAFEGGNVRMSTYSFDSGFFAALDEIVDKTLVQKKADTKTKNNVYMLSTSPSGLTTAPVGEAVVKFESQNYADEVAQAYHDVVESLRDKEPAGRLVLIDGPPGSGKTYFTRSLIGCVPNTMFILVIPSMVAQIGGPNMVPLLLDLKRNYDSIVFVLEDADEALAERGSDNMALVSSMLNMTSGTMGDIFKLRVIATTNKQVEGLEQAMLRTGRLQRRISIGELTPKQAEQVYRRLTGNAKAVYDGNPLLCDIYYAAKGAEPRDGSERFVGKADKKRKVGFGR